MEMKRIGPFSIYTEKNLLGKKSKTVYFQYRPVVRFNPDCPQERRVACVELVELGYCNKGMAGRICGFHRNTVSHLVQTKRILGIEGLIKDGRGPKAPWKYIGDIRKGIKQLLEQQPGWTEPVRVRTGRQTLPLRGRRGEPGLERQRQDLQPVPV